MAGSTTNEDKWFVCIIAAEENHGKMYRLPVSVTMTEIVERWMEEVGATGNWVLRKFNGPNVEGDEKLSMIGEIESGSKTVNLYIEEILTETKTVTINVAMYGKWRNCVETITFKPSQKPEALHPIIKECFSLDDDRIFCLRSNADALNYNLSFEEQDINDDDELLVDLAYIVDIKDVWRKGIETYLIYSSEALHDKLECDVDKQAVYFGAQKLNWNLSLATCLPLDALQLVHLKIHLEYQRSVTFFVDNKFLQQAVWPYEKLSKFIPKAFSTKSFSYEGKAVHGWQSFKEIGLYEDGIICQDRAVPINYSNGDGGIVWIPQFGNVADVREAIRKVEKDTDFVMKCGKSLLTPQEAIDDQTTHDNLIKVDRTTNPFFVNMPGEIVMWTSRRGEMRFSQFVSELIRVSKVKWSDLAEMEFLCDGCGRHICRAEEKFQLLPSNCCHVRSLHLTLFSPVAIENKAAQGKTKVDGELSETQSMSTRTKVVGRRGSRKNRRRQTMVETTETGCQTETKRPVSEASIQHSPPKPHPFFLFNGCSTGSFSGWKEVSLDLPATPTIGDLKSAVSRLLNKPQEKMRIGRWTALHNGARVVRAICDGGKTNKHGFLRKDDLIFTTEDGKSTGHWTQILKGKQQYEILTDDKASFILPPDRRLIVGIYDP